ncbi:MAG: hypothetical protein QGG09_18460 [Pirellulaceae bacterium]|nr:hypothetical protein [Pirellulaceae bacterium]
MEVVELGTGVAKAGYFDDCGIAQVEFFFGWFGSRATRERCFTVLPKCASPSTPKPAKSLMLSQLGLLNVCVALMLTAVTVPVIGVL